jgi:serine/threonine protein phosphatase 1
MADALQRWPCASGRRSAQFWGIAPMRIAHFDRNTRGRDLIVGDIHGCFSRLGAHLNYLQFDPARDRLFSVGDLIDRGPESEHALEWLAQPWFHAVKGNHEEAAICFAHGTLRSDTYLSFGGAWLIRKMQAERMVFADAFSVLPVAIEVETANGLIGIVHADCPVPDWAILRADLASGDKSAYATECMWSRLRFDAQFGEKVEGVRAVIVGHMPVPRWTSLGNVLYIDTGAVFAGGDFTILDLASLRAVPLSRRDVLEWGDD